MGAGGDNARLESSIDSGVETQHSPGVGGIEVDATRHVHRGAERLGQDEDEVEVMDGRIHGVG
eukprot:CAMPEP_0201598966 /NCGR_PEP_ID=MMETSP0492-20130828/608_1 /ASSEMBLY_ACC=CAM_ASM_000837 /TAXON_ID=420259 /ORGANISM="Thalassiosira gravida, Strain GMp14c1" /LENGTH=62 /DNA_ID=CAMNT_0048061475 /DNA_START=306 /DNA_END=494 /DNA_ORIENTATION=+